MKGPNPSGLCMCGCGEKTPLAPQSVTSIGRVKGEPIRFVNGHQQNGTANKSGCFRRAENGCIEWTLGRVPSGYAYILISGEKVRAHRFFYELANGPIPEGLVIDHLCRNKACINPAHLEAVTQAVNVQRGAVAKLTASDVTAIRSSTESNSALAIRYGVTTRAIRKARDCSTWKAVA